MIEISVNGESRTTPPGTSLADLIRQLDLPSERVAAEVNREIVRRENWDRHALQEGDAVEVVHFVGGGQETPDHVR